MSEQNSRIFTAREQQRCLRAISSGKPLDTCLNEITLMVSNVVPETSACIVLADEERKRFAHIYASNFAPTFGESLIGAVICELAMGTCGRTVYTGDEVTCSDIEHDTRWAQSWRKLCIGNGILACHSHPIKRNDNTTVGSLMLCLSVPREPTRAERDLAEIGSYLAAIALQQEAQRSGLAHRSLLQHTSDGFNSNGWRQNQRGEMAGLQPGWSTLTGQTLTEYRGYGWMAAVHAGDRRQVLDAWDRAGVDGLPFSFGARIRSASGEWQLFIVRNLPMFNHDGHFDQWISLHTQACNASALSMT